MENKNNGAKTEQKRKFTLAATIAFCLAICLFTFVSALDPLGIIGGALAILAAAMNTLLALDFADDKKRLILLLLIDLIPFCAIAVAFVSIAQAIPALYVLSLSLPIYLTLKAGQGRSVSIMAAGLCSAVLWLLYLAVAIKSVYGACNPETIGMMLDDSFEPIKNLLVQMVSGEQEGAAMVLGVDDIEMLLYRMKTLMLGTVVSMMITGAYLVTLAARLIAGVFDASSLLPNGMRIMMRAKMTEDGPSVELSREPVIWRIEIDSVSAGMTVAAYLASLIFAVMGNDGLIYYSVAQNLVVILSPGFIYCGLREAILSLRGRASFGGVNKMTVIFAVVLMFVSPSSIATLIGALGIVVTLRENRMKKHREKIADGKE